MTDLDMSYCVICTHLDTEVVRVVGPFTSQQAAVEWAHAMRNANRSWECRPDVMDQPTVPVR